MFKMLLPRFLRFRKEVVLLWRALRAPATPFYLKAATLFVALYLVSPVDLIPEFIPFAGFLDDLILVPLMMSWIVSRLPREPQPAYARARPTNGPVIDGSARRM
jgi:uncharacterized membrane protein YkvA (DUF1232 family)